MANIKVNIRTPKVPATLTIEMPGVSRGSTVPVSEFSDEELGMVGADYTKALKASARKMREEADGDTEGGADKTETPPAGKKKGEAGKK